MNKPIVIYQDDDVIAYEKPSGLLVHPDGSSNEKTLSDFVLEMFPEVQGVGEEQGLKDGTYIERHGIVHRLDRDTSGVILVARTQESFEHLKQQFKDRTIEKVYHTFVYGNIKEDEGSIDREIGRSSKDFRRWSAQRGARGKLREAHTDFKVLGRVKDASGEVCTYVEVFPKTGRTHQIRVHMKAIHHPVVCDPLYAEGRPCVLGFERLALHAYSITWENQKGVCQKVESLLPHDFKVVLEKMM